jgi:hypothetical protein
MHISHAHHSFEDNLYLYVLNIKKLSKDSFVDYNTFVAYISLK